MLPLIYVILGLISVIVDSSTPSPTPEPADDSTCISEYDKVLTEDGSWEFLKDIGIGGRIFDGDGITTVLANVIGEPGEMFKIFLKHSEDPSQTTNITLTYDHLLYDVNDKLIAAEHITTDTILSGNFIVDKIEKDIQRLASPITFSGYLQVNGIKASSYGRDETYATLAHMCFSPFRWGAQNINQQIFGVAVEWIIKDQNWYDVQLNKMFGSEFVYNQSSFMMYAPIIATIILVTRMLYPIMICMVSIIAIDVLRKK